MRWARVSPLLLAGCFGDPPSVETGETGSSITTAVDSSEASTGTGTAPTGDASSSTSPPDATTTGSVSSAFWQTITLDTMTNAPLADVPVLVRLTPEVVDYDAINEDGSDVRFYDASGVPIPFEIEEWHRGEETAVWVLLPEVTGGEPTVIRLGYGDAGAPGALPSTDVWANGYEAVWHLPNLVDATGNGHDLLADAPPLETEGVVGAASQFGEAAGSLQVGGGDPDLGLPGAGTVEAWVYPLALVAPGGEEHRIVVGLGLTHRLATVHSTNNRPMFTVMLSGNIPLVAQPPETLQSEWTHLAGTFDQSGGMTELCIVVGAASPSCTVGEPSPLVAPDELLAIGGPTAAAEIDEVRISRIARSEAWLRMQQRSIAPDFATFDEPVPQ